MLSWFVKGRCLGGYPVVVTGRKQNCLFLWLFDIYIWLPWCSDVCLVGDNHHLTEGL